MKVCPSCGLEALVVHCPHGRCGLVECSKCKSYGNEDRWVDTLAKRPDAGASGS